MGSFWGRAGRRGATTVELALVVPIVITLVFGAIEFSRYSTARAVMESAAQQAASLASVVPNLDAESDGVTPTYSITHEQYLPGRNSGSLRTECANSPNCTAQWEALKKVVDKLNNAAEVGGVRYQEAGKIGARMKGFSLTLPSREVGDTTSLLIDRLNTRPMALTIQGEFEPLIPWLGKIPMNVTAMTYREIRKNSSMPIDPMCGETCPCPGKPGDPRWVINTGTRQCQCAPSTPALQPPDCTCLNSLHVYLPQQQVCACPGNCPPTQVKNQGTCECECPGGAEYNLGTNSCACIGGGVPSGTPPSCGECAAGQTRCTAQGNRDFGKCLSTQCDAGKVFDPTTCRCECDQTQACPEEASRNPTTGCCNCPGGMQIGSGAGGLVCGCPTGSTWCGPAPGFGLAGWSGQVAQTTIQQNQEVAIPQGSCVKCVGGNVDPQTCRCKCGTAPNSFGNDPTNGVWEYKGECKKCVRGNLVDGTCTCGRGLTQCGDGCYECASPKVLTVNTDGSCSCGCPAAWNCSDASTYNNQRTACPCVLNGCHISPSGVRYDPFSRWIRNSNGTSCGCAAGFTLCGGTGNGDGSCYNSNNLAPEQAACTGNTNPGVSWNGCTCVCAPPRSPSPYPSGPCTCPACPTPKVSDPASTTCGCICPSPCPSPQVQNPTTCACGCPTTACPTGKVRNTSTCQCECESGKTLCGDACYAACPIPGQTRSTTSCLCKCSNTCAEYESRAEGSCDCDCTLPFVREGQSCVDEKCKLVDGIRDSNCRDANGDGGYWVYNKPN